MKSRVGDTSLNGILAWDSIHRLSVFLGRHAYLLLEESGKVLGIFEPQAIGNLAER